VLAVQYFQSINPEMAPCVSLFQLLVFYFFSGNKHETEHNGGACVYNCNMVVINISMYCLLCILMSHDMAYLKFSISPLCRAYIARVWFQERIVAISTSILDAEQYVN
jgi:hypothetical protein